MENTVIGTRAVPSVNDNPDGNVIAFLTLKVFEKIIEEYLNELDVTVKSQDDSFGN